MSLPFQPQDMELLLEDPKPRNIPRGLTMNRWIPQPSSGLICCLSALCAGLLFIIIIILVTITRQGVNQTEQSMEVKLRNLSGGVYTRVEKLSQDDSRMMEKLEYLETYIKDMRDNRIITKVNGLEDSVKRILSDDVTGSLASDIQRILGAVGKLTEQIQKENSSSDPLCEVEWKHYGMSCYYISQHRLSWDSAKKDCETKGAHLVVVNGEDENTFLHELSKYQTTWIGLTDSGGSWKWVDGTSYDVTPKLWQPSQPDEWFGHGLGGGEDCAQLKPPTGWNDDHCTHSFSFICEKEKR